MNYEILAKMQNSIFGKEENAHRKNIKEIVENRLDNLARITQKWLDHYRALKYSVHECKKEAYYQTRGTRAALARNYEILKNNQPEGI